MLLKTKLTLTSRGTIHRLKYEAKRILEPERRAERRYPLFRPVTIRMGDGRFSAFTRDISSSTVGLLHNRAIAQGEAEISIRLATGARGRLLVRIEHCKPCGAGWFISRGKFVRACGAER
jgi:hypothetical protein